MNKIFKGEKSSSILGSERCESREFIDLELYESGNYKHKEDFIYIGFRDDCKDLDKIIQDSKIEDWNKTEEAKACVFYMKMGNIPVPHGCFMYKGFSNCAICSKPFEDIELETPDHKYLFPESWWHYIEDHDIKPNNEEFIEDAVKFYKEHKDDAPKTSHCEICQKEFELDYLQKVCCSEECYKIRRKLYSFKEDNNSSVGSQISLAKEILSDIARLDIHIHSEDLEALNNYLSNIRNCSKCGAKIISPYEICNNLTCQILDKYDNMSNVTYATVLDDQELDYDTQKELLQIMFNLDIDKIQRVFVGNKKGYVIKD